MNLPQRYTVVVVANDCGCTTYDMSFHQLLHDPEMQFPMIFFGAMGAVRSMCEVSSHVVASFVSDDLSLRILLFALTVSNERAAVEAEPLCDERHGGVEFVRTKLDSVEVDG